MKLTFPHIVAYLVGGLVSIAALNPDTVTALLGSKLGGYAAAGIALAGALVAFVHDIWPSAAPTLPAPVSKQSGFVTMRGLVLLASAAISIACLTAACSTIESFLGSPSGTVIVTAAADVAVAEAEAKGVKAAQINSIAKAALAADASPTATVSTVASLVSSEITALKLTPLDQAAANILVAALAAEIQAKVGNSTSLAAAQTAVADVLKEVIAASGG
jgi:hypothetical protein